MQIYHTVTMKAFLHMDVSVYTTFATMPSTANAAKRIVYARSVVYCITSRSWIRCYYWPLGTRASSPRDPHLATCLSLSGPMFLINVRIKPKTPFEGLNRWSISHTWKPSAIIGKVCCDTVQTQRQPLSLGTILRPLVQTQKLLSGKYCTWGQRSHRFPNALAWRYLSLHIKQLVLLEVQM
jgi:hypothetical protein